MENKFILDHNGTFFSDGTGSLYSTLIDGEDASNYLLNSRYASPEETKEFFEELDENGYMWNGKMVVKKEQNKPKFHEGDWITDGKALLHITKFEIDYGYELKAIDGEVFHFVSPDLVEANYRLWTVQDAHDGDLIYVSTSVKGVQAIFHKFDNGIIYFHCYLCKDFTQGGLESTDDVEMIYPLQKTHYQRFFQKMKEAGYEWDAEKKELKKITTLQPKFRVGDIIKHKPTGQINTIKKVCSEYYILDSNNTLYFEAQDIWELVASKVKPTLEEKVNILADEIIALKQRVLALEIQVIKDMSTPPLTKDPILYPDKVTCNDVFKTPDRAGDNVTLEEMRNECKG